ncbi:MAG: hypothetical protein IJK64_03240 [Clostridia bacterium]|nr:hypothetical protein [Clostridia bacterium]
MSFIYAEKYREADSNRDSVRILCDTKVTATNYSKSNFSETAYDLLLKYGVVKSTICCPELCVSFAGNNTVYATKLFILLNEMKTFEVADVSDYAFKLHNEAPNTNDIEFIITYFLNDQIHIDCIKNRTLERDVPFAHIGSEDAFKDFQRIRLSGGGDAATQTERAFHEVVNGGNDETVGGNVIAVIYDYQLSSYVYRWERAFHSSKPQTVELGKNIIFYSSASDGGYSYEIEHKDIENVLITIDQMNPAILYSRRFRVDSSDIENPNLFGLMMPMLVEANENGDIVRFK